MRLTAREFKSAENDADYPDWILEKIKVKRDRLRSKEKRQTVS